MDILNKIQEDNKQRLKREKELSDLSICRSCCKKMINNTFKHGSRTGGSYDCECGEQLFF